MLSLQIDAHVAGVLEGEVGHVLEVDVAVVAELVLLVGEVDFRLEDSKG